MRTYKDGRDSANPPKTEDESGAKEALMIRMTPELKDNLKKASKKAKRSMNNYVCYLLEQALKPKKRGGSTPPADPEAPEAGGDDESK
jgi:hypothetical protein